MAKIYYIKNDWNDRTLCKNSGWVNDGRDTANFETESKAVQVLQDYINIHPQDADRVSVEFFEFEEELN